MALIILFSAIKALIVWFVVLYVGTNLVGMIGRGFFERPLTTGDNAITVISIIATIGICLYIYFWWGILFLIPVLFVMISRLPDLYWEVRILPKELGIPYPVPKELIQRAIKSKSKNLPLWDTLLTSLTWLSLPVLFLAFFLEK